MRLGTTYICVEDMGKSLAFYKALLQMEPAEQNGDRWGGAPPRELTGRRHSPATNPRTF